MKKHQYHHDSSAKNKESHAQGGRQYEYHHKFRFFEFISAIIYLKRFVKKSKKKLAKIKSAKSRKFQGRTALHEEILRSNKAVMQASYGRRVITINEVAAQIVEEEHRRKKEREYYNLSKVSEAQSSNSVDSPILPKRVTTFDATESLFASKRISSNTFTNIVEKIHSLGSTNLTFKDTQNTSKSSPYSKRGMKPSASKDSQAIDLSGIVAKNTRMGETGIQQPQGSYKGKRIHILSYCSFDKSYHRFHIMIIMTCMICDSL